MQRGRPKRLPMNEIPTIKESASEVAGGYQISAEPVVPTRRATGPDGATATVSAASWRALADDTLAVLPRDPKTLFVYWDPEVSRHFSGEGLNEKVFLRVLRADGTEEMTREVDLPRGYAFAEVGTAGARYMCELGCLDGSAWRTLVRSETIETPADTTSENKQVDFATLPFHLSFQRLIEIFRASTNSRKTLSETIAHMQSKAHALRGEMTADDWSQLVATAASSIETEAGLGLNGAQPNELAALLCTVEEDSHREATSPERRARWRQLGEEFGGVRGGASWGGESSR